jgi:hypothetical protein
MLQEWHAKARMRANKDKGHEAPLSQRRKNARRPNATSKKCHQKADMSHGEIVGKRASFKVPPAKSPDAHSGLKLQF